MIRICPFAVSASYPPVRCTSTVHLNVLYSYLRFCTSPALPLYVSHTFLRSYHLFFLLFHSVTCTLSATRPSFPAPFSPRPLRYSSFSAQFSLPLSPTLSTAPTPHYYFHSRFTAHPHTLPYPLPTSHDSSTAWPSTSDPRMGSHQGP